MFAVQWALYPSDPKIFGHIWTLWSLVFLRFLAMARAAPCAWASSHVRFYNARFDLCPDLGNIPAWSSPNSWKPSVRSIRCFPVRSDGRLYVGWFQRWLLAIQHGFLPRFSDKMLLFGQIWILFRSVRGTICLSIVIPTYCANRDSLWNFHFFFRVANFVFPNLGFFQGDSTISNLESLHLTSWYTISRIWEIFTIPVHDLRFRRFSDFHDHCYSTISDLEIFQTFTIIVIQRSQIWRFVLISTIIPDCEIFWFPRSLWFNDLRFGDFLISTIIVIQRSQIWRFV
jgi:hypothetical protein